MRSAAIDSLLGTVADRFDIVAIGVDHKGTVIVGVVMRAQPRRAVVLSTGGKCSAIKGIHGCAARCKKRDVSAVGFAGTDPERGFAIGAEACRCLATGLFGADFHLDAI